MTSKITRERLQEIAEDGFLKHGESKELARMALAAMDGDPFAYIIQDKYERGRGVEGHLSRSHVSKYVSQEDINEHEITCIPLYRHTQSVPVVSADLLHTAASAIEDLLTTKDRTGAGMWFDLPSRLRSAANAQPAPVVPDDVLAALLKVARIRLDLNVFDGDRRGIADCLGDAEEALIEVVNRCAAMLAAAPQPQNAPQNIPEIIPDCWCRTCRPVVLNDMRFVVCPDCGNKRCPRANDHRNACTGSNEPGQEGSAYPAAPQEVPDGK